MNVENHPCGGRMIKKFITIFIVIGVVSVVHPAAISSEEWASKGSMYNDAHTAINVFSVFQPTDSFQLDGEAYVFGYPPIGIVGTAIPTAVPVWNTADITARQYTCAGMVTGDLTGSFIGANVEFTVDDDPIGQLSGITIGRCDWEIDAGGSLYIGTTYYYYLEDGPQSFSGGMVEGDLVGEFHFSGKDNLGHPMAEISTCLVDEIPEEIHLRILINEPVRYPRSGNTDIVFSDTPIMYTTLNISENISSENLDISGFSYYLSDFNAGLFQGLWTSQGISNGYTFNYCYILERSENNVMPRLVGLNRDAAQLLLEYHGFDLGIITESYNNEFPSGAVILQSRTPGTLVDLGTAVDLTVSKGRPIVPDLGGMSLDNARQALADNSLALGAVVAVYDQTSPVDTIVGQTPAPGTAVPVGSAVTVRLSLGPAPMYNLDTSWTGPGYLEISPYPGPYLTGTVVTLTAWPDPGFKVGGWDGTDNNASTSGTNTVTMDGDKSVSVRFVPLDRYALTYGPTGIGGSGGMVTVSPMCGDDGLYEEGTMVQAVATPSNGWRFNHWEGDIQGTNPTCNIIMDRNKTIIAVFTRQFTLNATVNGSYGTIRPTSGVYDSGTRVTLEATPVPGYRLKCWRGTDNDTSTSLTNTVVMNRNRSVTVEFEQITYRLTYGTSGDGGIGGSVTATPDWAVYPVGTQVVVNATVNSGWWFDHWDDGTGRNLGTEPTITITMNTDKTIIAVLSQVPHYRLAASVINGHGSVSPTSGIYLLESPPRVVNLTATPDAGYRVKEWRGTDNDASSNLTNTVTMSSDKNVTVEFERITYTLTCLSPVGQGSVSIIPEQVDPYAPHIYPSGTRITVRATETSGWWFDHWEDSKGTNMGNALQLELTMDTNKEIRAVFNQVPHYSLTVVVTSGSGTVSPSSGRYLASSPPVEVTLTAQPAFGYRLVSWRNTRNDSSTGLTNTVIMDSDKTVEVAFERASYTLECKVVGGGTISRYPNATQYEAQTVVKLTPNPVGSYRFDHWEGDAEGAPTGSMHEVYITMDRDKSVTAVFTAVQTYSLNISVTAGNGSTTPPPGIYIYSAGTVVSVYAFPNLGYRIKRWYDTDNDSSTSYTVTATMNRARNVQVEFELIPSSGQQGGGTSSSGSGTSPTETRYRLTISTSGGGSISPASGSYSAGSVVTLTATPDTGYRIKRWSGTNNDSSTSSTNQVTMNSNRNVYVEFERIMYTLTTLVTAGIGTITPSGGEFEAGTIVQLTASPETGYQVNKWTGTNDDNTTSPTNFVTMNSDKTVSVEFGESISPEEAGNKGDDNKRWGICFIDSAGHGHHSSWSILWIPILITLAWYALSIRYGVNIHQDKGGHNRR